jgi:putative transposase
LIDESGFLMSPLVRRTLAPRGKTPILKTKASNRDRVSMTAALTLSARRHCLGLYWRSYPRDFVNSQRAADFLRYLLRTLPGHLVVVWDGGPMHRGEPIRELLRRTKRITLERLPPYAPELNPVEYLWNHLKYGVLPNFIPDHVFHLDAVVTKHVRRAKKCPSRLRGFCDASGLQFY